MLHVASCAFAPADNRMTHRLDRYTSASSNSTIDLYPSFNFLPLNGQHSACITYKQAVDAHQLQTGDGGGDHRGMMLPQEDSHILAALILHAADISNTARPGPVFRQWARGRRPFFTCTAFIIYHSPHSFAGIHLRFIIHSFTTHLLTRTRAFEPTSKVSASINEMILEEKKERKKS